jgi:hypothetical protein
MSDPIVSIAEVQRRAQEAFKSCKPMSSCPFPISSAARRTWNNEYLRLAAAGGAPITQPEAA